MSCDINGTKIYMDVTTPIEPGAEEAIRNMPRITQLVINLDMSQQKLGDITGYNYHLLFNLCKQHCDLLGSDRIRMKVQLDNGDYVAARYTHRDGRIQARGLLRTTFKFALKSCKGFDKLRVIYGILFRKLDLKKIRLEKLWNVLPATPFHPKAIAGITKG